ncbi:DUF3422 family protein [Neptunicella marina]|uniref:DUF3422 domain-containing protein n=1 Tax=Neptunicella marina TaxID=2125989 RepID=A0A8J6M347_9ALTE|nr:DUF3422 domain-containing protein [Neptunicella marina]MBC3765066.1 DUF3422 domain-containing protein [Neptunicella marina]
MSGLTLKQHPLRDALDKELQQRLFPALKAPCRVCQFMLTFDSINSPKERRIMRALSHQQGSRLDETDNDINLPLFGGQLRWEKHSEYSSFIFVQPGLSNNIFDDPLDFLPSRDWLNQLPGNILRIVQINVLPPGKLNDKHISQLFNPDNCVSSLIWNQQAQVWTDFQKHAEGAGRMLIIDNGLPPASLGRLVQQLLDLGNYRKLSLLGWPMAQVALNKLSTLEKQLSDITLQLEDDEHNDENLLADISQTAAHTEHLIAQNSARLHATAAYYQLTLDRLRNLNESGIPGMMSLKEYTERRLTPACRTCESVVQRQTALSNRLGRATELLRTRISLKLERQNQKLLSSMEKRVKLQLKMQQTVEGFSIVAISYYALQLAEKMIATIKHWLPLLPVKLVESISYPVVILVVIISISWLNRRLHKQNSD